MYRSYVWESEMSYSRWHRRSSKLCITSVDEMANAETFHGYAPDLGYEFLRSAIAKNDYEARGCDIHADEIFVSDGAKSDSGNIQEIFGIENKVAVCDPVYPVYVDTNVMAQDRSV